MRLPLALALAVALSASAWAADSDGTLGVEAAQAIFLGDWVAGCATLMGAK